MTVASTQRTHVTTGAVSGVIKGEFGFIPSLLDWADGMEDMLVEVISEVADTARTEIRAEAEKDELWRDLADVVDVEFSAGAFHYVLTGDPERVQAALDLEYGTETQGPRSLLRKHSVRQVPMLNEELKLEAPVA